LPQPDHWHISWPALDLAEIVRQGADQGHWVHGFCLLATIRTELVCWRLMLVHINLISCPMGSNTLAQQLQNNGHEHRNTH
jgi:hypothetical protein